jgi:hypothetical protein
MLGDRPRDVGVALAVVLAAGSVGFASAAAADQSGRASRGDALAAGATAAEPDWQRALRLRGEALNRRYKLGRYAPFSVREYRILTDRICTAAHTRLDRVAQAGDIAMVRVPNRRFLVPVDEPSHRAYQQAAREVMAETLPKLRAVAPPASVRARFTHLYGLLGQFARGEEAPFSPTAAYWIHQVERERSLFHCTFSLGR